MKINEMFEINKIISYLCCLKEKIYDCPVKKDIWLIPKMKPGLIVGQSLFFSASNF